MNTLMNWLYQLPLQNAGGGGGGGTNLFQIAFVDKNGNDGTAVVGDLHHPFLSISAALAALNSLAGFREVWVFNGSYTENITISNPINVRFIASQLLNSSFTISSASPLSVKFENGASLSNVLLTVSGQSSYYISGDNSCQFLQFRCVNSSFGNVFIDNFKRIEKIDNTTDLFLNNSVGHFYISNIIKIDGLGNQFYANGGNFHFENIGNLQPSGNTSLFNNCNILKMANMMIRSQSNTFFSSTCLINAYNSRFENTSSDANQAFVNNASQFTGYFQGCQFTNNAALAQNSYFKLGNVLSQVECQNCQFYSATGSLINIFNNSVAVAKIIVVDGIQKGGGINGGTVATYQVSTCQVDTNMLNPGWGFYALN